MRVKVDFPSVVELGAERDAKERRTWARKHAPGPPLATCEECGAFAPYAQGNLLKDQSAVEHFCQRHAPDSLKRPGDFPSDPRS